MARSGNKIAQINRELAKMRIGERKTVRIGPGRGGLVTLRRGKRRNPTLLRNIKLKKRAKTIRK